MFVAGPRLSRIVVRTIWMPNVPQSPSSSVNVLVSILLLRPPLAVLFLLIAPDAFRIIHECRYRASFAAAHHNYFIIDLQKQHKRMWISHTSNSWSSKTTNCTSLKRNTRDNTFIQPCWKYTKIIFRCCLDTNMFYEVSKCIRRPGAPFRLQHILEYHDVF